MPPELPPKAPDPPQRPRRGKPAAGSSEPPAPSAETPAAKALSRRSLLGLGAVAGAGAGAAVAAGISSAEKSSSSIVVDANGVPVVSARAQQLSELQQDQAARNIGVVRTVEPEQFDGASDDEQLNNAFAALRETGGEIRLRPGKAYVWRRSPDSVDWSGHGQVVLTAWGATINYAGSGAAFTSLQSRAAAGTSTMTVLGGEWVAPDADAFFAIVDSGNHLFYRCRGQTPNGTFFHLSNRAYWSERNHFIDIEDHNCQEVLRFSIDGSSHESFARTLVRDLRLQGGKPGHPKINVVTSDAPVQPAPYDSRFDGIVGNIADGVIVQRLAGGMSGTRISGIQVESPQSSTSAAVWQVGELARGLPLLLDGPPVLRNVSMFTEDSVNQTPFGPNLSLGGLATAGAVSGTDFSMKLAQPGAVTIPADRCNLAVISLEAACTGCTIESGLMPGSTQQLTIAFVQAGGAGNSYSWPDNCRFAHGAPPVDVTPGTQTSVTFALVNGMWLETARAVAVPIS